MVARRGRLSQGRLSQGGLRRAVPAGTGSARAGSVRAGSAGWSPAGTGSATAGSAALGADSASRHGQARPARPAAISASSAGAVSASSAGAGLGQLGRAAASPGRPFPVRPGPRRRRSPAPARLPRWSRRQRPSRRRWPAPASTSGPGVHGGLSSNAGLSVSRGGRRGGVAGVASASSSSSRRTFPVLSSDRQRGAPGWACRAAVPPRPVSPCSRCPAVSEVTWRRPAARRAAAPGCGDGVGLACSALSPAAGPLPSLSCSASRDLDLVGRHQHLADAPENGSQRLPGELLDAVSDLRQRHGDRSPRCVPHAGRRGTAVLRAGWPGSAPVRLCRHRLVTGTVVSDPAWPCHGIATGPECPRHKTRPPPR